jgi:hypothetical protein
MYPPREHPEGTNERPNAMVSWVIGFLLLALAGWSYLARNNTPGAIQASEVAVICWLEAALMKIGVRKKNRAVTVFGLLAVAAGIDWLAGLL